MSNTNEAKHTPTLGFVLPLAIICHENEGAVSIRDNGGRGEWVAACLAEKADPIVRACNSHDALIAALEPLASITIPENASGHDTIGYANGEILLYVRDVRAARAALKAAQVQP